MLIPKDFGAEVVFMIDSSLKITTRDFNHEIHFVKAMAKLMELDKEKIRSAVITYGNYPELVIDMGNYESLDDFNSKLGKAPKIGGFRQIDKALGKSIIALENARPGVPRLIILLTAGEQIPGISKIAQTLKDVGAKTFVVTIGSIRNTKVWQNLVSKSEDVFKVPRFEHLLGYTSMIAIAVSNISGNCWRICKCKETCR